MDRKSAGPAAATGQPVSCFVLFGSHPQDCPVVAACPGFPPAARPDAALAVDFDGRVLFLGSFFLVFLLAALLLPVVSLSLPPTLPGRPPFRSLVGRTLQSLTKCPGMLQIRHT